MAKPRLTDEERAARKKASDRAHYVKNQSARKARQREYYSANRGAVLARQAADRHANPEKWRVLDKRYHAAYKAADPERFRRVVATCSRNMRARHPERIRRWEATWRAANTEKLKSSRKLWEARNRQKLHAYTCKRNAMRSASKRSWLTGERVAELFDEFGGKCAYCLKADAKCLDHIVALARGGKDEDGNVVPACRKCNSSKNALSLLELLLRPHRLVTRRMFAR